jgi:hypothetical protein
MNQKTFDDLLQSSRNQFSKTLFSGELQGNTDTYLKPTDLNSQDRVPPPPKPLFCEEGATVDLDKRMNMLLQPQVPRNPELEALNSYFNQQRVESFARGQTAQMVSETIQKQAEVRASQFVRDEMDRRAGIRRQVLDMTGLTPAQISEQMVAESFAGINPRTMDMRERQVQDAVARFYAIQNIPTPATEVSTNPVPATISTESADTFKPEDIMPEEADEAMPGLEPLTAEEMGTVASDPAVMARRRKKYDPDIRELPSSIDAIARVPKFVLTSLIINTGIRTPETTNRRTGELKSAETLDGMPVEELRRIVEDAIIQRASAGGGGGGGGVGNPAL